MKRHVSRDKHDAKILRHKAHREFFGGGQIRQELSMARKAVAAEEQCALVNGRRGDRIDASRRAQFDRRLDVTSGGFAGVARFDSGLDVSLNVIEMKDYGIAESIGKAFIIANDLVSALQIQRARIVRQQLSIADDYRDTYALDLVFGNSL